MWKRRQRAFIWLRSKERAGNFRVFSFNVLQSYSLHYFSDTEWWLLLSYRSVQILSIHKLWSFFNLRSLLVCISNISRDLTTLHSLIWHITICLQKKQQSCRKPFWTCKGKLFTMRKVLQFRILATSWVKDIGSGT